MTSFTMPPGGMSLWGLYIIRVNHFLKSTLNEDEATVPTALWTLHRACAPGYRSQISYPFRGSSADLSGRSVNLIPFFSYFPVFDTLNAIRALRAGWRNRYPFYAFLLTRMMYRPQWDMPPTPRVPCPFPSLVINHSRVDYYWSLQWRFFFFFFFTFVSYGVNFSFWS